MWEYLEFKIKVCMRGLKTLYKTDSDVEEWFCLYTTKREKRDYVSNYVR